MNIIEKIKDEKVRHIKRIEDLMANIVTMKEKLRIY